MNLDVEGLQRIVDRRNYCSWRTDCTAFAEPFHSKFGVRGRRLHVQHADVWYFCRAGQHVIQQRRGERLSLGIERHHFIKASADALRRPTADLPINDHRVDQGSAIFDYDIIQDFDYAGGGIDGYNGSMGGVGEGSTVALGAITLGYFKPTGVDVGGGGFSVAGTSGARPRAE